MACPLQCGYLQAALKQTRSQGGGRLPRLKKAAEDCPTRVQGLQLAPTWQPGQQPRVRRARVRRCRALTQSSSTSAPRRRGGRHIRAVVLRLAAAAASAAGEAAAVPGRTGGEGKSWAGLAGGRWLRVLLQIMWLCREQELLVPRVPFLDAI